MYNTDSFFASSLCPLHRIAFPKTPAFNSVFPFSISLTRHANEKPANGAHLPFHPAITYFGIIVLRVH